MSLLLFYLLKLLSSSVSVMRLCHWPFMPFILFNPALVCIIEGDPYRLCFPGLWISWLPTYLAIGGHWRETRGKVRLFLLNTHIPGCISNFPPWFHFWCPWFLCPFHFLPLTWPGGRSDFLLLLISELHHVPQWFLGSSITYVASSPYWHLSVLNTQNSICFQARHTNIGSVRRSALMLQAPHAILEILNSLPKTEY